MSGHGKHRKPKGIYVSTLQITVMILFGTLGVIMVLASQTYGHHRRTA